MNVEQDQVEAALSAQLQSLPGILGKAHPVAIAHQQAARHLTVQRDVLDHQDIQAGAYRVGRVLAATGCPWAMSSSNQKQLPCPCTLSRPMQPPSFSTRCLQIARPSPVPP